MRPLQTESNFLINEESFEWLFSRNWTKVYTICFNGTSDQEQARDLTQNIFKSIWERRDQLNIVGNPENYLFRAAKLQLINYYRDSKIRASHLEVFYSEYSDIDQVTEHEVLFNELNNEVQQVLNTLPGQCRLVYQLSSNKQLSNREVAETLDISVKTVEYHLTNARKLLKRKLVNFI